MRLALVLAALVLCGGASAAAAAPFEVPAILSLTGSGSALATAEAEGLHLLADAVNKSGGVRGRPIAFTIQDDQSSPQIALQLASTILAKHPPIVIATTLVAGCSAILPLVTNGPVTYCLSSGMYPPKDSYMFAYGVPTKEANRLQIKFYHDRGWKRLAVIVTNDATGQDFERNLDAALALPENRDEVLVARERFGASDVSVNAQVATIKAGAPQALIVWATGTPLGTVFHAMTDLGLDVPTATNGSNLNYNTMKVFANILPRDLYFINVPGIVPDAVPPGPLRSAAAAYYNALKSAGVQPDSSHLVGWDPGTIIVSALKTLGFEATPAQYRQYIANLHGYYGASGEYDFRDGSQRGLDGRSDLVLRYDARKQQFVAVQLIGSAFLSK
jgi:branched-chain amino acid transport system substrate-binding protein